MNHVCAICPPGKTSTGNHDASGADTACDATACAPGADTQCDATPCGETARPAGTTSTGSHDASGPGGVMCNLWGPFVVVDGFPKQAKKEMMYYAQSHGGTKTIKTKPQAA